jgi:hypothetical protein
MHGELTALGGRPSASAVDIVMACGSATPAAKPGADR